MKFNIKEKSKTYSFWLSIAGALFLLIQAICKPFGIVISEDAFMSIINSILGIFVVIGLISSPSEKNSLEEKVDTNENNIDVELITKKDK